MNDFEWLKSYSFSSGIESSNSAWDKRWDLDNHNTLFSDIDRYIRATKLKGMLIVFIENFEDFIAFNWGLSIVAESKETFMMTSLTRYYLLMLTSFFMMIFILRFKKKNWDEYLSFFCINEFILEIINESWVKYFIIWRIKVSILWFINEI